MTALQDHDLTLLERCYDSFHAHMIRGLLESNDIPCFLMDDQHTALAPHLTIAIGGIRVMVWENDLAAARDLITADHGEEMTPPPGWIKKPYWRSILAALAGLIIGIPADRPQGKYTREDSDERH